MSVPPDSEVAVARRLLLVVGLGYLAIQLIAFSLGRPPSWDEAIYLSQVAPGAEALPFVPSRARGITFLAIPVLQLGGSLGRPPALPRRRLRGGAHRGVPHVGAGHRARRRRGRRAVRRGVAGAALRVRADAEPLGRAGVRRRDRRARPPARERRGSVRRAARRRARRAGGAAPAPRRRRPHGRPRPPPDRPATGDDLLDRPSRARAGRRVGAVARRDGRAVRVTRGGLLRGGAPRAHGAVGRVRERPPVPRAQRRTVDRPRRRPAGPPLGCALAPRDGGPRDDRTPCGRRARTAPVARGARRRRCGARRGVRRVHRRAGAPVPPSRLRVADDPGGPRAGMDPRRVPGANRSAHLALGRGGGGLDPRRRRGWSSRSGSRRGSRPAWPSSERRPNGRVCGSGLWPGGSRATCTARRASRSWGTPPAAARPRSGRSSGRGRNGPAASSETGSSRSSCSTERQRRTSPGRRSSRSFRPTIRPGGSSTAPDDPPAADLSSPARVAILGVRGGAVR